MPRKKPRKSAQAPRPRKVKATPVMPFSLILTPAEMAILRKEAARQGTSVGTIVRGALHAVLFRTQPEFLRRMVNREVESFLDSVQTRYPGTKITPSLRGQIQRRVLTLLRGAPQ